MHPRGTPKPDAFGSALSVLENGFQYSADYDDDDDFNWSRLPDVTEHGSFGRCMVRWPLAWQNCLKSSGLAAS
jgi:hypothetical protein